jgi:acyl-CoA thioester hydrolase
VSGYLPIYRGVANAWECDVMGHLNVQHYTAKLSEGLAHLRAAFGMTPSWIRANRKTMIVRRSLNRHFAELRAGAILGVEAQLLRVGEDDAEIVAEALNAEDGRLSASFELRAVCFDLEARREAPWPDELRPRLEALIGPRRDAPRAPSSGTPSRLPSGRSFAEPLLTGRGAVMAWQADEHGHMAMRFYLAQVTNAVGHMRKALGLDREHLVGNRWGSAALEYRIDYLRELRAGDIVSLHSGLLEVGAKTFRYGHRLIDEGTGDTCALYDVVTCMFDLDKRRAMAIPDFVRAPAEAHVIPWPPEGFGPR